jgi:hypothetical protein
MRKIKRVEWAHKAVEAHVVANQPAALRETRVVILAVAIQAVVEATGNFYK